MTSCLDGFEPDGRIDLGTDLYLLRFRREQERRFVIWATGANVRKPVPAPSERVRIVKPWTDPATVDAPDGWVMLTRLDATPHFLIPV
jgi:hypothetical protein